jgi:hypothetical protein
MDNLRDLAKNEAWDKHKYETDDIYEADPFTMFDAGYKAALSHSKERIAELEKDAERFVVRRKYADMVCYAYAHHNGFFDWGVLSQAVKLDTKLQAVALISSMRLANDESVTVENMNEAMKGSNDGK